MDTKWKNIKENAVKFFGRYYRRIAKSALIIGGIVFFYNIIVYRGWHPTGESIFFGILGNLLVGTGIWLGVNEMLDKKFKDWLPDDDNSYAEWKEYGKNMERGICIAGAVVFLLAVWYLSYLMGGGMYWVNGPHSNFASGYVMIFTALIQFIVSETALKRFQKKQLDYMMEQMENLNRRRLDVALEIEKKSLEKVSRSDQLRVDLITNVSHDLKTPLTSMVGYIELIRKEELSDTVRDYVDVISDRAEKLKEMVNSLFSLAKASSGNVELHPEKFEVNRMIEQIFADMDDQIKSSGLEFVTRLTEESTEIVSDNSYFYRICQNLMENALKIFRKRDKSLCDDKDHQERTWRG